VPDEGASVATSPEAPATEPEPEPAPELIESPGLQDLLPAEFEWAWQPWTGDLDAIVERRVLRVLTPYGGYQFYFDNGRPRGATVEMLARLEAFINEELGLGNVKVYIVPIPVSRDQLIPGLLEGKGDLAAADLTVTDERKKLVSFTRPLLTDIREVVVLGPTAPAIGALEDLADQEIFVRPTSSYAEHIAGLADTFEEQGLEPPVIVPADEILEAEDLLDLVQGGVAGVTIMDDYKAEFWAGVMHDIDVRNDLVIADDRRIAWAHRKEDEQLAALLERFLRKFGKGSAFGNDVYRRHLKRPERVRCAGGPEGYARVQPLVDLFRKYGEQYGIPWLRLGAQAYQESGLRQDRRSPAGAIGVMQIKPSTAADRNVGIDDITTAENNVHAGAKYMRFIADRYFDDPAIDELNQWLFTLAAYNAGPAKVARLRREAEDKGYDRNRWFDNVEIIAARRIGRETVSYVSNIFRYYLNYQLVASRSGIAQERYGDVLSFCQRGPG
jgi:membrane-bound lytic murein transglycosylase MltF